MNMLAIKNFGLVRVIGFETQKNTNPFSKATMLALIEALRDASEDANTKAIVLTGGEGKSFCAGGDFNEVRKMRNVSDVEAWIDDILDLYTTVLRVPKPCVAAIDLFAIGIGFQLALMCDYRVGTKRAQFILPELRGGISCTIGGILTERFFGRMLMQKIIYECKSMAYEEAMLLGLLNRVVDDQLIVESVNTANEFAKYSEHSFRQTKMFLNRQLVAQLNAHRNDFIISHAIPFENHSAETYMNGILKDRHVP
jgi:carboxymethylproline synthase